MSSAEAAYDIDEAVDLERARGFDREQWRARAAAVRPETRLLIGGEFVEAGRGGRFESHNPVDGAVVAEISRGGPEDVDRAVASGLGAFRSGAWSRLEPRRRMEVLGRFADLIEAHGARLALLDCLEMGKPIRDLLGGDVPGSALAVRFFAETVDKLEGALAPTRDSVLHYIRREPLGVVGAIVPWNYPLMMAAWKIAPALAMGNSVVLKPAEQSSLSALVLGELFLEAGGPPGVLNVVPGFGKEAGAPLALHGDVAKIAFTGSLEVGKEMLIYAGRSNMKRVSTECGGKSPQIVLADAPDLDRAVTASVQGIYANQGEVCNAGSRLLVERSIVEDFVERFRVRTGELYQPGDPLDPATSLGPLVSAEQQRRVLGYIETGRREGAELCFGGGVPEGWEGGCYVEPTLFTGVGNRMTIAQEEIFGPVAAILPFDDVDEAVGLANDSIYGLTASVWTRDLATAHRVARDVEAGVVWVNCFDQGDMTLPWGGFKQSGFGRDKCFETLYDYTQTKGVWIDLEGS